jgi:hypothetical protein
VSEAGGERGPAEILGVLSLLRRAAAEVECAVQGASMGTSVPDGASVRIRFDGGAGAAVGAVVAVLIAGDTFAVHRLVHRGRSSRARGAVVTSGDGNVFCEAPLPETAVLGTVTAVRLDGAQEWRPVPPPARHHVVRRVLTAVVERAVCGALELSPRLGMAVTNAVVLAVTPLVWLRPYEAGRVRSGSRLSLRSPVSPR